MSGTPLAPERVAVFPTGELAVAWSDGHESFYPGHELRCACACAACVEETTGRKTLDDRKVPADVRPEEVHPVGRYGLGIRWSDGHDTGIYTFARLRELCSCGRCRAEAGAR